MSPPAVLTVDLGGTRLRAALGSSDGPGPVRSLAHGASRERPLPVEAVIAWLKPVIGAAAIDGIGVSVAGTVDRATGTVVIADNLGWRDTPLGEALASAFGVPVHVDTDAFCGAAAEARCGGVSQGTALSVVIGTGIGHAWIVDGRVWRGTADAATMFGHLIVEPGGRPCYCGSRGCLCQYAAGPALDTAPREPATAALALAIAHALTLMNPDQVVLGGGAVTDGWPDIEDLTGQVTAMLHPAVRPVALRRSTLGDQANLLGAALLVGDAYAEPAREER